jgi:hypothetical protein
MAPMIAIVFLLFAYLFLLEARRITSGTRKPEPWWPKNWWAFHAMAALAALGAAIMILSAWFATPPPS